MCRQQSYSQDWGHHSPPQSTQCPRDGRKQTDNNDTEMEKPERREEIAKCISMETKKVNDRSLPKREDGIFAFLEIIPFIRGLDGECVSTKAD